MMGLNGLLWIADYMSTKAAEMEEWGCSQELFAKLLISSQNLSGIWAR